MHLIDGCVRERLCVCLYVCCVRRVALTRLPSHFCRIIHVISSTFRLSTTPCRMRMRHTRIWHSVTLNKSSQNRKEWMTTIFALWIVVFPPHIAHVLNSRQFIFHTFLVHCLRKERTQQICCESSQIQPQQWDIFMRGGQLFVIPFIRWTNEGFLSDFFCYLNWTWTEDHQRNREIDN